LFNLETGRRIGAVLPVHILGHPVDMDPLVMAARNFELPVVEDATLAWLEGLGYAVGHAPDIAPGEPQAERDSYDDVVLVGHLRRALSAINTHIPSQVRGAVIDDVIFALEPGELTNMIETPMGYHIFRLEEKQQGTAQSLEEAREMIFATLYREKTQKRFQDWMEQLKRNAYISIR